MLSANPPPSSPPPTRSSAVSHSRHTPRSVGPFSLGPNVFAALQGKGRFSLSPMLFIRALAVLLVLCLVLSCTFIYFGQRQTEHVLGRQTQVLGLREQTHALRTHFLHLLEGTPNALQQLRDGRQRLATAFANYPEEVSRQNLQPVWEKADQALSKFLAQEKGLQLFAEHLPPLAAQPNPLAIQASSYQQYVQQQQSNGVTTSFKGQRVQPRLELVSNMLQLADKIATTAQELSHSDSSRPDLLTQLERQLIELRSLWNAVQNSPEIASDSPESIAGLAKAIEQTQAHIFALLNEQSVLLSLQEQQREVKKALNALTVASDAWLSGAGATSEDVGFPFASTAFVLLLLALLLSFGIFVLYRQDMAERNRSAKSQRHSLERTNQQNQEAILRLMNELGALAQGDLTIKTTVNEDITGAIADSINYTVGEFRKTVQRINTAAEGVAETSAATAQTSQELLAAARQQGQQIRDAEITAQAMYRSMHQVSAEANRSAAAARQALDVATHGAQAVQDAMKGMNGIREQIQETAKRIKRLGENSMEIGEIVQLISDITEQTHVLALNAAIQAASAGDAGRGFSVVAEEVQRLAERSSQATQQIAKIVKTIQADTRNAVSAMERSTLDVVEGARLSDGAGKALSEVGEVSARMSNLIAGIAEATQTQARTASQVAEQMQLILQITEQTSIGTQHTAQSVTTLERQVSELKQSVAGFKVN